MEGFDFTPGISHLIAMLKAYLTRISDLLQVFRDMGVEIQVGDEDVTIRFKRQALEAAEQHIKGGD